MRKQNSACHFGLVGFASLLGLLLSGCTRPSTTAATISLQIPVPKAASSKTAGRNSTAPQVQVVIVNVTGSGFAPIFVPWNASDQAATPPTTVTATVPYGATVLIQALVVIQNSDQTMTFNYGDTSLVANSSAASATVTVAPVGGAASGQGTIMGRYLTGANTGPTGVFNVMLNLPGKPPMIVQQNEIFNGYFTTFGLQTAGFNYVMADGSLTLGSNVMLTPSSTNPALNASFPGATAMIYVPNSYRCNNSGSTPCTTASSYQQNQTRMMMLGFFGPGVAANNQMCYDVAATPVPIQSGWVFSDVSNPAAPLPLNWQTAPLLTAATIATTSTAGLITGGMSKTSCTGTAFVDYLYLPTSNVTNGDSALSFQGPYQSPSQSNSGNYLQFSPGTVASPGLTVAWTYLPGAAAGISGSEVFYLKQSGTATNQGSWNQPYHDNNGNGFYCSQLVKNFGFTSAGQISSGATTQSLTIPNVKITDNVEVIVCPYQSGLVSGTTYFTSGVDGNPSNTMGGGPQYYLTWQASATNTTPILFPSASTIQSNYAPNTCKAYTITVVDSSNNPVTMQNNTSLNINDSGVYSTFYYMNQYAYFYAASGCSGTQGGVQIPAGASTTTVWMSTMNFNQAYGIDMIGVSAMMGTGSIGPNIQQLTAPVAITNSPSSPAKLFDAWMPLSGLSPNGKLVTGSCYGVAVGIQDSGGQPVVSSGATTVTLSSSSSGGFYTDPKCANTATQSQLTINNESVGIIYFMPTAVAAAITLTASTTTGLTSTTLSGLVGDTTPASLTLSFGGGTAGGFQGGMCNSLNLLVMDSAPAPIPQPSISGVSISATSATLYNDTGPNSSPCTSSNNGQSLTGLQWGGTSPFPNLNFRATAGATEVDLSVSSSAITSTTTRYSNLWSGYPGSFTQVTSVPSGSFSAIQQQFQLLVPGGGNPAPGTCYPLLVYITGSGNVSPSTYGSDVTVVMALQNGLTGGLYSDSGCTTALPSNTTVIPAGSLSSTVYFSASAAIGNCSGIPQVFGTTVTDASANAINHYGLEICPQ